MQYRQGVIEIHEGDFHNFAYFSPQGFPWPYLDIPPWGLIVKDAHLFCRSCGRTYEWSTDCWRCICGLPLHLLFQPRFARTWISERQTGLWRYRNAIPIQDDHAITTLGEPTTPLFCLKIAGKQIWVKGDHLMPTGSFKDRGAAVLVSHAREIGVKKVVEDSSGNAGAALAAYCARAAIRSRIYVPESTSPAKLIQILNHGSELKKIAGSRQDTARAVQEAAGRTFYASHVWNSFFLHGIKTFAYEICEQLAWKAPAMLFLPTGNGSLLLGVYLGFCELMAAGIVRIMPRFYAVQAAACSPLYRQWKNLAPAPADTTLAEGIAVPEPPRAAEILEAVRGTCGEILAVSEKEIEKSHRAMGRQGFFMEPTSAVVFAALERYVREAQPSGTVATLITGHGLKSSHL